MTMEIPLISPADDIGVRRVVPGTVARDLAIASIASRASGGLLAWFGRGINGEILKKNPRGRGAIVWATSPGEARALEAAVPEELEGAYREIFPFLAEPPEEGKRARLLTSVIEAADGLTVSESVAWEVYTRDRAAILEWSRIVAVFATTAEMCRHDLRVAKIGDIAEIEALALQHPDDADLRGLLVEKRSRRDAEDEAHAAEMRAITDEKERVARIVESDPAPWWRIRHETGLNRRVSWYDESAGRRRQAHLGDLLIVVSDGEPTVSRAKPRKARPKADYPQKFWGWQAKSVPEYHIAK